MYLMYILVFSTVAATKPEWESLDEANDSYFEDYS